MRLQARALLRHPCCGTTAGEVCSEKPFRSLGTKAEASAVAVAALADTLAFAEQAVWKDTDRILRMTERDDHCRTGMAKAACKEAEAAFADRMTAALHTTGTTGTAAATADGRNPLTAAADDTEALRLPEHRKQAVSMAPLVQAAHTTEQSGIRAPDSEVLSVVRHARCTSEQLCAPSVQWVSLPMCLQHRRWFELQV